MERKHHRGFALPLLMLSFSAATGLFGPKVQAQSAPDAPPNTKITAGGHSYWKHPDYDAVLEVWTDPQTGLRGRIVSLNAQDEKIKTLIGKILKKDEKEVSVKDVLSFVGMEGDLHLHREGDKWTGSIYWPFKQKSYGVDVEQTDGKLHVRGFLLMLPIIGRSIDLKPAPRPQK